MASAAAYTVLTLLTALLLVRPTVLYASDDGRLADGKPKPAVSVASAGTAGATDRTVPPLEECLRRINIITAQNDEGHQSVFESLRNDGIIDCDCDYWVFAAQVHGYTTFDSAIGRQFPRIKATTPLVDTVKLVRERHPGGAWLRTSIRVRHSSFGIIRSGRPSFSAEPI